MPGPVAIGSLTLPTGSENATVGTTSQRAPPANAATAISIRSMDPRRFGAYADKTYIIVKTKEDYEVRHDTPMPGYNRKAGRPWRTTPVYDRQKTKGAVFGEVHGWERPRWFADAPGAEDSNGWRRQPWFEAVGRDIVWLCGNALAGPGLEPLGFAGGARRAVQTITTIDARYLPSACRQQRHGGADRARRHKRRARKPCRP